ncbi:MAG: hypothetical protein H8E32_06405 [Nitrospinae bacterium]|nr:hypothetical protein [Nitrospinota bacterium]
MSIHSTLHPLKYFIAGNKINLNETDHHVIFTVVMTLFFLFLFVVL